jgi:DNA polymerase-4
MRKIIHIDMDAFYAAVEQRDNPQLKGKPVAVGGNERRGVVSTASYEARVFGVRSAMPGAVAARLCPQLIFVKPRFEVYKQVSIQIRSIFLEYTDLVEPLSLDEAFLDVTEDKLNIRSASLIAQQIRQKIHTTTGLTASAGVSFNKFLAKIASDIHKPNGMKVILPEEAEAFLEQLPVKKFHGIGKVTAERMHLMGIHTGADLKQWSQEDLYKRFGKAGGHYYRMVRAMDDRPVQPYRGRKSIGVERTFEEDLNQAEAMLEALQPIIQKLFAYQQKSDNYGRTLTLKWKTPEFKSMTRSITFQAPIEQEKAFTEACIQLFKQHESQIPAVRLLGFSVSNLKKEAEEGGLQLKFPFSEFQDP